MTTGTVLLADDDDVVRSQLRSVLELAGFSIVAESANGRQAVGAAAATNPELAVLDFSMGSLNGIEAGKAIAKGNPATKLILITGHSETPYVIEALNAGFVAYVIKSRAQRDLVLSITAARRGSLYVSPELCGDVIRVLLSKGRKS